MTIYLYSGTPGSGKSLHTTMYVRDWVHFNKGAAICNYQLQFPWHNDQFFFMENSEITPEFLQDFALNYWQDHKFREDGILLVLDECQLLFNAREWGRTNRMAWLQFFSQHRHYGYRIIFVAQFDRMIDRQIRSLIEYNYIHRKVSNFGWKGKLLSAFLGGNFFVAVKIYYPLNERIGCDYFRAHKKIFKMYDSFGAQSLFERNEDEPAAASRGVTGSPRKAGAACPIPESKKE